jgi:hypothetical protein
MREGGLGFRSVLGELFAYGPPLRRRKAASAQTVRALKELIVEGSELTRRIDPGEGVDKDGLRIKANNWLITVDQWTKGAHLSIGRAGSTVMPGMQTDFPLLRMIISHRLRFLRELRKQ